jgi:hypothetical protein
MAALGLGKIAFGKLGEAQVAAPILDGAACFIKQHGQ